MSESLILVVAILALAATVFVGVSIATQRSMWGMMGGGGMMHDETSADPGPGGVEWLVLLASAAFFIASVATIFRGRTSRSRRAPSAVPPPPTAVNAGAATETEPPRALPADELGLSELTLVRLLDEDERRMYLEIRERGGEVLQRDLVALGTFSKAKVTRVLDKLEAKGLVVRERHGMTNRVRIVIRTAR